MMSSSQNRHLPSALNKVHDKIFILQLFAVDCIPLQHSKPAVVTSLFLHDLGTNLIRKSQLLSFSMYRSVCLCYESAWMLSRCVNEPRDTMRNKFLFLCSGRNITLGQYYSEKREVYFSKI